MRVVTEALWTILFRADAQRRMAHDPRALGAGLFFVAVEGLVMAGSLYPLVRRPILFVVIPAVLVILSFVVVGVIYGTATLFGGRAGYLSLYRSLAPCSLLGWLRLFSFLPYFDWIGAGLTLWRILILYTVLRNVSRLSSPRAAGAIAVLTVGGALILRLMVGAWQRGHAGFLFDEAGG